MLLREYSLRICREIGGKKLAAGRLGLAESYFRDGLRLLTEVEPHLVVDRGEAPWLRLDLAGLLAATGRAREALPLLESLDSAGQLPDGARELLAQCRETEREMAERERAAAAMGRRTLFIHDNVPRPDQSGAEKRVSLLLEELRRQGHAVTYLARYGYEQESHLPQLAQLCTRIFVTDAERLRFTGWNRPATFTLEEALASGPFDLAVVSHWHWSGISCAEQYLDEIRRLSPVTRIAVLSEDHHGLREARLVQLTEKWQDRECAYNFEARELDVYRRADVVWAVSSSDKAGILRLATDAPIEVLPPVADEVARATAPFAAREGVLFLGEYANPANRDGVEWFLEKIWPRALKLNPRLRLSLAGPNLPQSYLKHRNVAGLGFLPSLDAAFAAHRLAICPIRYGTGIKTKNLAALAYGLPFVSTSIGAEGMDLEHGRSVLIADDADAFAQALARLHDDAELWERLAAGGRAHAETAFSRGRLASRLRGVVEQTLAKPAKPARARAETSPLLVDDLLPNLARHEPAEERVEIRLKATLLLAEQWLAEGRAAAARDLIRQVFTFTRSDEHPLMARIWACLTRCHDALAAAPGGDVEPADPFSLISGPVSPTTAAADLPTPTAARQRAPKGLWFSVILPTHNRRDILAKALAGWAEQTLAPDRFEVIVVDDGSSDDTRAFLEALETPFSLRSLRRPGGGVGAARAAGVEAARGDCLLLVNDDSLPDRNLLAEHRAVWRRRAGEKLAVLGDFRYPPAARRRALTCALSETPVFFPQASLVAGSLHGHMLFMTCNLSVARAAVLKAGNFDGRFHVAEDTEMGARLERLGYRVLYQPAALAWHDHLDFKLADVVARARRYGPAFLSLFRKHPRLLREGATRFGRLDAAAFAQMRALVSSRRREMTELAAALSRFDDVDFLPFFAQKIGEENAAEKIVATFAASLPDLHWFHLYESLLEAVEAEDAPALPYAARSAAARPDDSGRLEAAL